MNIIKGWSLTLLTFSVLSGALLIATTLGPQSSVSGQIPEPSGPGPFARLGSAHAVCGSDATVTFRWLRAQNGIQQWLDLSLHDNNFAPGTFLAAGPLDSATSEITWPGLVAGMPHYWRVNTWTADGWVPSQPLIGWAFVPCGPSHLRGVSYACTQGGRAAVDFLWAPSSPIAFSTWVDLTVFTNGFAPGTFVGNGPISPGAQSIRWQGILANVNHYWRVNLSYPPNWLTSPTGSFIAHC